MNKIENLKIKDEQVIYENDKSSLIFINKAVKVWVSNKFIKKFDDGIKIGIVADWWYNALVVAEDQKEHKGKIKGTYIIKSLNNEPLHFGNEKIVEFLDELKVKPAVVKQDIKKN